MPTPTSLTPSLTIIVPAYAEADNLPLLIPEIAAVMSAARGWLWELIVVDDNSPDGTAVVLEQLAARFPQLRYKIRVGERGLASAVLTGLAMARHDYVVVMDADLSHAPESIPDLIRPLLDHSADFVVGSRFVPGASHGCPRLRRLRSVAATALARPIAGAIADPMSGFFALRRSTLENADELNPIGYKVCLELLAKMRLSPERVCEVPISFRNRIHGRSKLTLKEQFRYLEHLSRLYDYRFPVASPRCKFLIAAGCGAAACFATLAVLDKADIAPFISLGGGIIAMILVTLVFFLRYVHAQRDFLVMKHPYSEFAYISMGEFVSGWAFAVSTHAPLYTQIAIGLVVLLLVRYTLRKVFLHDLRGIRSSPRGPARLRLTLAPSTSGNAASA